MEKREREKAKRWLIIFGLLWFVAIGWFAVIRMPDDAVLTMESQPVKDRMANECTGSFSQRYVCKEAIVLEVGRVTFFNLTFRLLATLAGPIGAAVFFARFCRPDPVRHQHIADDMSWKLAAQEHVMHAPFMTGPQIDTHPVGDDRERQ